MITFTRTLPLFILSVFIWTLGEILIVINFGTYVANHSPQNYRTRFNAVASMSSTCGSKLSTTLMGSFMKQFGVTAVWPLLFFIGIAGAIEMYLLKFFSEKRELLEASQLCSDQ